MLQVALDNPPKMGISFLGENTSPRTETFWPLQNNSTSLSSIDACTFPEQMRQLCLVWASAWPSGKFSPINAVVQSPPQSVTCRRQLGIFKFAAGLPLTCCFPSPLFTHMFVCVWLPSCVWRYFMIVLILSDFCWYQRAESKKGHPTKFKGAKLQGWSSTPQGCYLMLILAWALSC